MRTACGLLVLTAASRICSRYAIKSPRGLFGAERIPEHVGNRGAGQPARGAGLCRLALLVGKVDEISTTPDQFAPLKQSGNLPDQACLVRPSRRPGSASRRDVARTCDGGPRRRSGLALPLSPWRTRRRSEPGLCRGTVPIGCLPFTPPERIFPGAAGILSVRLSETVTLMHVHPRLRSNVTPVVQPANQACSPA